MSEVKKYKLKTWYPSMEDYKEGDVFVKYPDKDHYGPDREGVYKSIPSQEVENNPEFWEEVLSYEILTFKHPYTSVYVTSPFTNPIKKYLEYPNSINNHNIRPYIICVVKDKDGRTFKVGDSTTKGDIYSFVYNKKEDKVVAKTLGSRRLIDINDLKINLDGENNEKKIKLDAYSVFKVCGKCGNGDLRATGIPPHREENNPPKFQHKCSNKECNNEGWFTTVYPTVRHEKRGKLPWQI